MKKDCVSRELTIEVIVGFFVVMILFGLAYFTFIISGKGWFKETYSMEVVFQDVMGLRLKDNVVVRGMPVGEVKGLELKPDGVHVTFEVNKRLKMYKDYKISIVTTSILGGRYLQVHEGSDEFGEAPADYVYNGAETHDLMRDAAELVADLRKQITGKGGIVDDLKLAVVQIREIATRLNEGKGSLGKLLSEDDQIYNDLKATVASLRQVSERLDQGKSTLGKLLSEDDKVYQDLKSTVASLKEVSGRLEDGKGLMGKLVADDDTLYNSLKETVEEVRATIDDLRETTPVVSFTSILFGAF